MGNPLIEIREARGADRPSMARQMAVSYRELAQAELGYPVRLTHCIVQGLARIGVDVGAVQAAYISWRQGQRAEHTE